MEGHHHADARSHLQSFSKVKLSKKWMMQLSLSCMLSFDEFDVRSRYEMIAARSNGMEGEFVEEKFGFVAVVFISALSSENVFKYDGRLFASHF